MSLRNRNRKGTGSLVPMGKGNSTPDPKGSLRRAASGGVSKVKKPGRGLGALEKASKAGASLYGNGSGKVAFVFDATYSRDGVWEKAKEGFQKMFESVSGTGSIKIRFIDFGSKGDINDHGWTDDVEKACEEVSKVKCRVGITQINPCLRMLADGDEIPDSIVYVGDHYEESEEELKKTIRLMKEKGIKVFTFLDSEDREAERIYKRLAEETGGAFAMFGEDMPLEDLCVGVALLSSGGVAALRRLRNAEARRLLAPPKP